MDQDATWYEGRPRPRDFVFNGTQQPAENGTPTPPIFWPMSILAKRLDGSRCH